jgi:hypothetical protein
MSGLRCRCGHRVVAGGVALKNVGNFDVDVRILLSLMRTGVNSSSALDCHCV